MDYTQNILRVIINTAYRDNKTIKNNKKIQKLMNNESDIIKLKSNNVVNIYSNTDSSFILYQKIFIC